MGIPQISVPIAFALGLPIGVAGYFGQWAFLRGRRRRRAEVAGGWGPSQGGESHPEAAAGVPDRAVAEPLVPVNRKALADQRQRSAKRTQLHKREAYLERALDALVGFVDGDPRRARARICAREVARLVPKTRRPAELEAFLADVEGKKSPSDLQDDAEQVGILLAVELKAARTELESLPS
jgi:hypothetical protein